MTDEPTHIATAAAPQPTPDREALVGVILGAMLGRYPGRDMARAVADALLARGLRLPAPGDPYAALSQHLHGDGDVRSLRITYRNWRGEVGERNIVPQSVWFGATEWHPEPQWLLSALDTDKGAARDFALADFGANDDTWRTRALAAEADVERLRAALAEAERRLGGGCDATGDQHVVIKQGSYSFCAECGESLRRTVYIHAPRAALAEGGPDAR